MLSSLVRNGARALRAAPAVQDAIGQQTRTLGASSARWYADAEIDLNKEQKREVSPKVQKLADEFCSLTLLEVADLTDILKERLGGKSITRKPLLCHYHPCPRRRLVSAPKTALAIHSTQCPLRFCRRVPGCFDGDANDGGTGCGRGGAGSG